MPKQNNRCLTVQKRTLKTIHNSGLAKAGAKSCQ